MNSWPSSGSIASRRASLPKMNASMTAAGSRIVKL